MPENRTPPPANGHLDIVASGHPVRDNVLSRCRWEIDQATCRLDEIAGLMLRYGWASYDIWAHDLVRLETLLQEWGARLAPLRGTPALENLRPALARFRTKFRVFQVMFNNNRMLLSGMAGIAQARGQGYGLPGGPAPEGGRATFFQLNEGV